MDPSLTEAFLSWPIQGALYHGMGLGLLASTAAGRERAVGSIMEIMEMLCRRASLAVSSFARDSTGTKAFER